MNKLVQIHFKTPGPFGAQMAIQYLELAESIKEEPGFIWKIWTENAAEGEAGGIYYFEDEETARAYVKMHTERLKGFGIEDIHCSLFDVNEPLTVITNGPL